ncbi:hypothetical protein ASG68_09590 [Rhizobium sp. Leaf453]|nr:hypothetical protein ASG50_22270 [Rhizobium sp. Leaf386]KQT97185.1 hypothetical protein ASG68_09590 [Rhizobium sp. Leaf453]
MSVLLDVGPHRPWYPPVTGRLKIRPHGAAIVADNFLCVRPDDNLRLEPVWVDLGKELVDL